MKYRLTRSPDVPLRDQIATQIFLGIGSGELTPGTRLPSTREMARRFHVHPNTVSSAYRQLAAEGRVTLRKGSGVFIAEPAPSLAGEGALDRRIAAFFAQAQREGVAAQDLRRGLLRFIARRPSHLLLVEPDADLRAILLAELQAALAIPVEHCGYPDTNSRLDPGQAIPLTLPSKADKLRSLLTPGAPSPVVLQITSVPASLTAFLPAPSAVLVAIASSWPPFLEIARTILVGAGFEVDRLLLLDAREPGWQLALKPCDGVVCDAHTALGVRHTKVIRFAIVCEASLAELQRLEQTFTARDRPGDAESGEPPGRVSA